MSSNATPKERKRLTHRRDRQLDPIDYEDEDQPRAVDSFIEPVTKTDPRVSLRPALQREPPRAKGP
jgi:hypothetical protein